jgi:hypothetical protein
MKAAEDSRTPSLKEIEDSLALMSGCLGDHESAVVPSHWAKVARAGAEPRSIRRPQEYGGGAELSILCTQLDVPAKQQRLLVEEWCETLPTLKDVRTLWFQSRVPQALFEAACRLPALEGLWIKWSGITGLDALPQLGKLRYFHLGQSGGLRSLSLLAEMPRLEWLQLGGTVKATDIESLAPLSRLIGLGFTGGDGQAIRLPSLAPLSRLSSLRWLHLGALRVEDKSLRPLAALPELEWLHLPNWFAVSEFAWLSTRLPRTTCEWLAPFSRLHRSVFPCQKCKTNCRVMTTGRPSRLLCPSCDTSLLARHVAAFNRAVEAANAELADPSGRSPIAG